MFSFSHCNTRAYLLVINKWYKKKNGILSGLNQMWPSKATETTTNNTFVHNYYYGTTSSLLDANGWNPEDGMDVPLATPGRDDLLDRAGITPRGEQPTGAAAITLGIRSSETAARRRWTWRAEKEEEPDCLL
jgi:hypothetical protein